jgi:hypothetical protein
MRNASRGNPSAVTPLARGVAIADEDLYRHRFGRRRNGGELRTADLLDIFLQFDHGQSDRSRWLLGDDDLGQRPTVVDDQRLGPNHAGPDDAERDHGNS